MKYNILLIVALLLSISNTNAQLTMPVEGGSAKASVSERVGITDIGISYSRPAVNGREGKIWGGLVYNGYKASSFGYGNPSPWRAGANENTIIEFSTNVIIEGKSLPAGKYGFFIAYAPDECTIIFSKNTTSWGNYFYQESDDALRVKVKPLPLNESKERLTYEFSNETDSSATIALVWEKLKIPFLISTELQKLQMASFENELRSDKGFDPHAQLQIASYLSDHNLDLEKALKYANTAAASMPTFDVLTTQADIYQKLNNKAKADSIYKNAYQAGSSAQLYYYGLGLMEKEKNAEAMEIFKINLKRFPNDHMANIGIAKGYSATGDNKNALKYATKALSLAPDERRKTMYADLVKTLKEGKKISS